MTFDFSHFQQLEVSSDSTAECCLIELEGEPTLMVRPANESNPAYMNARLRMAGQGKGFRKLKKVAIDTKELNKLRQDDRELFPEHVIIGWKNVCDSNKEEVPFSLEACTAFVNALPDWIFDIVRGVAVPPESFVETIDSEEKAGN